MRVEVDPRDVGLAPERLGRVSAHFRRYVDDGRLPGWAVAISRGGEIAYLDTYGKRDMASGAPIELDTIYRVFSMTKPITTVAAMMLWEEGAFELKDPVRRFIPSFADTKVWRSGSSTAPVLEARTEELAIWHLMTHTSGLTYGFLYAHPVDELYRRAGFEWGVPEGLDLDGVCDRLASLPLLFQPGREWNYSMATDVLGRVVEVASGMSLDRFLRERIFVPLGMVDSDFHVPSEKADRLATLYGPQPKTRLAVPLDGFARNVTSPPRFLGGGGGCVSTLHDYHRFAQMLLRGGELDGVRLLGSRTVGYMAQNHLPGGADLTEFGRPLFAETALDGVGFGLGVSVTIDEVKAKVPGSEGSFGWGGAASTWFRVDPLEEIVVVFLTQLLPSSTHPIRTQLAQLVQQALVD